MFEFVSTAVMEGSSYQKLGSPSREEHNHLPSFDTSERISLSKALAVGCGVLLSFLCIFLSIIGFVRNPVAQLTHLAYGGRELTSQYFEAFSLLVNLALTFVTDGLSFIHSLSLRWALAEDGKLEFNTNIRLLTSSRLSAPNRWWVNVLSLATLILCYGSTSVLFVSSIEFSDKSIVSSAADMDDDISAPVTNVCGDGMCANMVALLSLGIGLAVQTAIAVWCLLADHRKMHKDERILTWSANPLNASLAAQYKGLVCHQANRCMVSVHQRDHQLDGGVPPSARQGNAWAVHQGVRYTVYLLWALAVVAIAWPLIIADLCRKYGWAGFSWTPDDGSAIVLAMSPAENTGENAGAYFSFTAEMVLGVLFITGIQALQTTGLHMMELLVNLSRDEAAWRQATTKKGASYCSEPFYAAATSWENIILFIAKAVLHWIIGQSLFAQVGTVVTSSNNQKGAFFFVMAWSRLIVFAACAVFIAGFGTFLALRKPRGPQPAAWGHLQTLANLVDDWTTNKDGRFWWGDKTGLLEESGGTGGLRHAGTKDEREKLGVIAMDCYYAG